MKAYLRVDPLMDERKAYYSDGQFRAFVKLLCVGARQEPRGRFRNVDQAKALLGRHGRFVAFLISQGDAAVGADGSLAIEGWDTWQEGDLTVAARMAALRNRRRNGGVTATVTGDAP